jgi:hypothetical protein
LSFEPFSSLTIGKHSRKFVILFFRLTTKDSLGLS